MTVLDGILRRRFLGETRRLPRHPRRRLLSDNLHFRFRLKGDLQDSRSRPSMFQLTGWPIKLGQPVLKDG